MRFNSGLVAALSQMADSEQETHDEKLHQFAHDFQTYLHVVALGTELLKGVRDDDKMFAEVCTSMDCERRDALALLNAFLKSTCKGCA